MKAIIEKSEDGHYVLPLPNELISEFNLKVGDKVEILQRKRGILVVPLPDKTVKNRNGEEVKQLYEVMRKNYKGVNVEYVSCYYLDHSVDENTGVIDNTKLDKFYTMEQSAYDIKAFKEAYQDALDGKSPQNAIIDKIDPNTLHDEIDWGDPVGNEEW